jgi:hypothetical protein
MVWVSVSFIGILHRSATASRAVTTEAPQWPQLVLLSAAAQREDGAVEVDPKLKGSASRNVLGKLLSE